MLKVCLEYGLVRYEAVRDEADTPKAKQYL